MVLKLQNSLEKSNFVKQLILKTICEIKTNLVDFEQYKLNQQLININNVSLILKCFIFN